MTTHGRALLAALLSTALLALDPGASRAQSDLYFHAGGQRWPLEVNAGYVALATEDGSTPETLRVAIAGRALTLRNPFRMGSPANGLLVYEALDEGRPAAAKALREASAALAASGIVAYATPVLTLRGSLRTPCARIVAAFPAATTEAEIRSAAARLGLAPEPLYPAESTWLLRPAALPARDGIGLLRAANALVEEGTALWASPDFLRQPRLRADVNDPYYQSSDTWHLNNTGQFTPPGDIDVNAPEGWDVTKGLPDTIIAIIDTGADLTHEDIAPNVWTNPGEIAGNGLDDDGNGYTDDIHGWDLNAGSGDLSNSCDPHGLGCAGVAAARGDNGIGTSGVCPNCSLMTLQLLCGWYTETEESAAFRYAADNGAAVMSNSWGPDDWGCPQPCPQPIPDVSRQALDYAVATGRGGRGTAVFWASGNGATTPQTTDDDGYASYEKVVNVGAVADTGTVSWYSEGGSSLDACAPSDGGTMAIFDVFPGNQYTHWFGGTSSASPLAAGVGALALSWVPAMRPDKLQKLLQETAKKVGPPGSYDPGGHADSYGFGMVRAGGTGGEGILSRIASGVILDRAAYLCVNEDVVVSVRDASGLGNRSVLVRSTSEAAGETVICAESDPLRPGLYTGSIPVTQAPAASGDGLLSISDGDTVTAEYGASTDTAQVDCDPLGCATLPDFAGIAAAADRSGCLPTGIDLNWDPVASWGDGPPGVYNIYRSTDPAFVPSPAALVQSVTTTSWTDLAVSPGTAYSYIVRAENGRTLCSGPHGGVEDSNLVRIEVTDSTSSYPVFAGLDSATDLSSCERTGIELAWGAPSDWGGGGPGNYNIYRGANAGFTPSTASRIASVPATQTTWVDTPPLVNTTYWYIVRAENDRADCDGPHQGAEDPNLSAVASADARIAPPVFFGLDSAGDADPCAASGVLLSWTAPSSWGPGGPGWFDIYRSEILPIVPGPATYLASLPSTELSWTDSSAVPGVQYHYVVRAESAATGCPGPNGGRDDSNLRVRSASDDPGLVAPSPDLLGVRRGPSAILLAWQAIPGASHYNAYRGTLPSAGPFAYDHECFLPGLVLPAASDSDPTPAGARGTWYLVSSGTPCGEGLLGVDSRGLPIPFPTVNPCP